MVVAIPSEGYCQATDVSVLTGRDYTANSTPTLTEVETSIKNATGLINSRLLALGQDVAAVGDNAGLLAYLELVAARWASYEVSYSLGDTDRGDTFYTQAHDLLDRLDRNVNVAGQPFGTEVGPAPQKPGVVYGAFPGTGEIAGEPVAAAPSNDFALYTALAPDLQVLDDNNRVNVLRIDDDRPLKRGDLLTATAVIQVQALPGGAVFAVNTTPDLILHTGQQEITLKDFPRPIPVSARSGPTIEMTGRYVAPQDLADWHVVARILVPNTSTSQDINVLGSAGNLPRTYLQVQVIGARA